jgi:hypothetical protein
MHAKKRPTLHETEADPRQTDIDVKPIATTLGFDEQVFNSTRGGLQRLRKRMVDVGVYLYEKIEGWDETVEDVKNLPKVPATTTPPDVYEFVGKAQEVVVDQ